MIVTTDRINRVNMKVILFFHPLLYNTKTESFVNYSARHQKYFKFDN